MTVDVTKSVREVALNIPAATRVFEKLGIDYCCGGNKSLQQACGEANLQVGQVIESLTSAAALAEQRREYIAGGPGGDWQSAPLADLVAYIIGTHHKYVKTETARLRPLFDKVCNVHGLQHPELADLRGKFLVLAQELSTHMMKEEMVLFPYVERMEEAVIAGEPILPAAFGTVNKPVEAMVHEHESTGNLLRCMRELSDQYSAPKGACTSYRTLYGALEEFERDLHQHIHLENNILFPRAVEMEEQKQCRQ